MRQAELRRRNLDPGVGHTGSQFEFVQCPIRRTKRGLALQWTTSKFITSWLRSFQAGPQKGVAHWGMKPSTAPAESHVTQPLSVGKHPSTQTRALVPFPSIV